MKPIFVIWMTLLVGFLQTGCGTQIGLSGQAREEYLKSIKPYIEYWHKPGMTEQGRRQDSWECGAGPGERWADTVQFSPEQVTAERLPSEASDFPARTRLSRKWVGCMRSKGYQYVP